MLLKTENEPSQKTPRASAPLTLQNRSLCAIPPHRQVRGHMRSQEEGAVDVALEGSSAAPPAITLDKTRARIGELPLHPGSTGEY